MAKPIVTYELLEDLDACRDALDIFEKEFPFGAEVSKRFLTRAAFSDLDLAWLFTNETLIEQAGLSKVTIRKGFVTLKDGLLHSFKKRPSLVTSEGAPFVTLAWHKYGRRTAYATLELNKSEFSFFSGRLGTKRKRKGREVALRFAEEALSAAACGWIAASTGQKKP